MFNAGLQRGKRGLGMGGVGLVWCGVGVVGEWGVPREISLHLSVPQTDVGEYQPSKQSRGPRMLMGPFVPAQPGPAQPGSVHLPDNYWELVQILVQIV